VSRVDTWGPGSSLMAALGITPPALPSLGLLPTLVTTSGAMAMAMSFAIFGRRRRDDGPPAPDRVLAAEAARGVGAPVTTVVTPALDVEAGMPRWRRPSLLQARKADPMRDAVAPPRLSFDHGLVGPIDGRERRLIRYNVVSVLDTPDELRGSVVAVLDRGDEVQLLEKRGVYWLVLSPDGTQGWIHKMTLGDHVDVSDRASGPTATMPTGADSWTLGETDVDGDVFAAYLAARRRT
jgi:hypothetical protein